MRKNQEPFIDEEQDDEIILISKSSLKRDAQEIKALGEQLANLSPAQLEKFPLEGRIIDALRDIRRITSFNARKRQFGFIGKLMMDQDIDAIRHQLAMMDPSSEEYTRHFYQLERWRDRMLGEESNAAVTEFLEAHPATDVQKLRQMIRNTLKEKNEEKRSSLNKKLFRYLREMTEE
ncbi:ribosome biogenesis factor YjgA [Parendozoicomonas haliclonae]|uniref:Dual-action ribosomal maturation protein DarP n=1 Tax=Parendozoicomonas haliclonae TaxID=1960125 RepID=A0A1X7AFR5_9GAMM|nr:ribosome biogenesis factor YjgA [Parendozoicomonas haliclonae]SMA37329.1 hypothetical protein EHSB41UT_00721 [Parendozoicomonas haliclonae]